jgi:beta-lactam-binding protein with PASTA domain
VAAGLLLFAAGAAVVATRDDGERRAPILTVPKVTETDVIGAYDLVREAGFRVEISTRFTATSLCVPIATEQLPPAGAPMPGGGVVTISAGFCPLASPAFRTPMPTATVPDFTGKPASEVVAWASSREMLWSVRGAPALAAGSAPHLLDNYRVTRQTPRAGTRLRPGVFVQSGGSRGFRPTPITVWVESG